jgi:hypothetical protein
MSKLSHTKTELRVAADSLKAYVSDIETQAWSGRVLATFDMCNSKRTPLKDGFKHVNKQEPVRFVTTVCGVEKEYVTTEMPDFGKMFRFFFEKPNGKSLYPNDFYYIVKRLVRTVKNINVLELVPLNFWFNPRFIEFALTQNEHTVAWMTAHNLLGYATAGFDIASSEMTGSLLKCLTERAREFLFKNDDWSEWNPAVYPRLFVDYPTEVDPEAFSDAQILYMIKRHPLTIAVVPENRRTIIMMEEALKRDGMALQYVPEALRTPSRCDKAIKHNPKAEQFVPK